LPLERYPGADAESRRLQRLLRDVHWNPQRHVDGQAPAVAELIRAKREWIERPCKTHVERAQRYSQLRRLNEQLDIFTRAEEDRVRAALADAERRKPLHEIRSAREYSFCLYPAEMLQSFYQQTATRFHNVG